MELDKILGGLLVEYGHLILGGNPKPLAYKQAKQALTEWRDREIAKELEKVPKTRSYVIEDYIEARLSALKPSKDKSENG